MSKTADALRLSSARTPLAIGQMSVEDILGSLSEEQKTGLTASLAANAITSSPPTPVAGADDGRADPDPNAPDDDKETEKAKKKGGASDASEASDDFAKGFAAATERARTVMASEHFEGRASHAHRLLGNAKLSADEIVETLADMPDGSGQQMLDKIRSDNPDLGTGGGNANGKGAPGAAADHGWAKAHARAAKLFGGAAQKK